MKKEWIAVSDFSGSPIHYHLLTSQTGELTQYGVQSDWRGEEVSIPEITTKKGDVLVLLALLQGGSVPPISLRDIVEDWLER